MTEVTATVVVDLTPMAKFQSVIEGDLRRKENGPVRRALRQWAARYRGFLRERWNRLSRGGGVWPALSEATRRRRRGFKAAVRKFIRSKDPNKQFIFRASILRDTNTMFAVVSPTFEGKPGQLQEDVPFGVKVGFGGPGRHPDSTATIADIAMFHQRGGPHLPKREIVVEPDGVVRSGMQVDMQLAVDKLSKDTGNQ